MKKNKTSFAGPLLIIIVLLAVGLFWLNENLTTKLTLINESAETLTQIELNFARETLIFKDIAPDTTLSQKLVFGGDGHFDIKITFPNGTILEEKQIGYITSNDGSHNIFRITADKQLRVSRE